MEPAPYPSARVQSWTPAHGRTTRLHGNDRVRGDAACRCCQDKLNQYKKGSIHRCRPSLDVFESSVAARLPRVVSDTSSFHPCSRSPKPACPRSRMLDARFRIPLIAAGGLATVERDKSRRNADLSLTTRNEPESTIGDIDGREGQQRDTTTSCSPGRRCDRLPCRLLPTY